MAKTLRKILADAVKSLSFKTTVDDLKRKGIKRVNVIGIDRMVGLVEEAVRRTIAKSLYAMDSRMEAGSLASKAKEEFVRLLEHTRNLERARDEALRKRKELEKEIDQLRLELVEAKERLEKERKRIQETVEIRAMLQSARIAEALKRIFTAHKDGGEDIENLEKEVLNTVLEYIENEKNRSLILGLEEKDQEIQKLRRRVGKLSDALEKAEGMLKEMAENGNVAQGISSVFKTVQGLDRSDPMFTEKKSLLKEIFLANLKLQKGIGK